MVITGKIGNYKQDSKEVLADIDEYIISIAEKWSIPTYKIEKLEFDKIYSPPVKQY